MGRHGETMLNEDGRYRGLSNGPDAQLNGNGHRSAHEQGQFLSTLGQRFSKIICSPLDRAQLTAAIIAGYLNIAKLQIDSRLLPLNVGSLAGQPKSENPIHPYLKDKNKRFPDGETINEFEARQHSFALDLLDYIEAGKQEEDSEILVIAHVSNVMYWWNLQANKRDEEYLSEASDILLPGGLAIVTEHATVPIFRANEVAKSEGNVKETLTQIENFSVPPDHKPGMRVPKGGSSCFTCEYVSEDKKHCSNKYFQKWNGSDKLPAPADEYCSDWYEEEKK